MGQPISQRGHALAAEFSMLRQWSKHMVLVYRAELLHSQDPGGFSPFARKLRVVGLRTELRETPEGLVMYRCWVTLSDRSRYRLEWHRVSSVGLLIDLWERVPWSAKGKGKGRTFAPLRTAPVASAPVKLPGV